MRSIKIVLGLGLAIAMMMAVSVSSASATWDLCTNVGAGKGSFKDSACKEKEEKGAWEWKEVTGTNSVKLLNVAGGKLKLEDMKAETEIECTGEGQGTVGSGNKDVISSLTASSCSFVKAGKCESSKPVTANAVDLPWSTELILVSGATWDSIKADGAGEPGWNVECTVLGIFKISDECKGEAKTKMTNLANGKIESAFEGEASGKAKCSVGGAEQGLVSGAGIIEAEGGNGLKFLAP
jgi:hypothetical protein